MGRLRRYRSFRSVASILLLVALWGSPHWSQDDSACLPDGRGGARRVEARTRSARADPARALCDLPLAARTEAIAPRHAGSTASRSRAESVWSRTTDSSVSDTSALPLPARAPPSDTPLGDPIGAGISPAAARRIIGCSFGQFMFRRSDMSQFSGVGGASSCVVLALAACVDQRHRRHGHRPLRRYQRQ